MEEKDLDLPIDILRGQTLEKFQISKCSREIYFETQDYAYKMFCETGTVARRNDVSIEDVLGRVVIDAYEYISDNGTMSRIKFDNGKTLVLRWLYEDTDEFNHVYFVPKL